MSGVQRESEMARYLRVVGGTDDELVNTVKLQTLQLQAANHHCRRMETLLEKLDAATETLIRCCGVDRSELRPQVESKPVQWLGSERNLQQQLQKGQHQLLLNTAGEPPENKADRERYDEALAEMLEQRENELYQKLMEKLERDEQREKMRHEEQPQQLQAEQGAAGTGLQGEQSDHQLARGLEQQQTVAEAGMQQEESDDQLGSGLEEKQMDRGVGQQPSIDQPPRKSRWRITALCLSAAPLIYYGLLPWLWSVVEDNAQLVHLSPPLC